MRTILSIVTIDTIGGCAGTRSAQDSGVSQHTTPVVSVQPSISDRLRYSRQQKAEQVDLSMTEVWGGTKTK